eukprot:842843_1
MTNLDPVAHSILACAIILMAKHRIRIPITVHSERVFIRSFFMAISRTDLQHSTRVCTRLVVEECCTNQSNQTLSIRSATIPYPREIKHAAKWQMEESNNKCNVCCFVYVLCFE